MLVDTPLGRGQALFIIDYGMHQNSCWVVALEKNGVIKHFDSNDVIVCTNFTYNMNYTRHTNCPDLEVDKNFKPDLKIEKEG